MSPVEDAYAHFLVTVGAICHAARIGSFHVLVLTEKGASLTGIPEPHEAHDGVREIDGTGLADELTIGGATIALTSVVEIRLRRDPHALSGGAAGSLGPVS